jgi:hypothetical protein
VVDVPSGLSLNPTQETKKQLKNGREQQLSMKVENLRKIEKKVKENYPKY